MTPDMKYAVIAILLGYAVALFKMIFNKGG